MDNATSVLRNDPSIRLAQLEAQQIARFMVSEASALRRACDHVLALAENTIIERILVRRIKKAFAGKGNARTAKRMLHETRGAYSDGSMETLPSFLPQSYLGQSKARQPDGSPQFNAPKSRNRPLIYYLAGGGFIMPTSRRQKLMIQKLSENTDCEVKLATHRLAPEHTFPTAVEDFAKQFSHILQQETEIDDIFIGADTAGASVALGAMQLLQQKGEKLPAGVILFSPWCDLTMSGWSYITNSVTAKSPFRMETAAFCARLYLQGASAMDPLASPIFADMTGWPPVLIHTCENDLHFDDAIKLAENGRSVRCDVRLNYWDSPRHHLERLSTKDAQRSFAEVSKFIDRVWQNRNQ